MSSEALGSTQLPSSLVFLGRTLADQTKSSSSSLSLTANASSLSQAPSAWGSGFAGNMFERFAAARKEREKAQPSLQAPPPSMREDIPPKIDPVRVIDLTPEQQDSLTKGYRAALSSLVTFNIADFMDDDFALLNQLLGQSNRFMPKGKTSREDLFYILTGDAQKYSSKLVTIPPDGKYCSSPFSIRLDLLWQLVKRVPQDREEVMTLSEQDETPVNIKHLTDKQRSDFRQIAATTFKLDEEALLSTLNRLIGKICPIPDDGAPFFITHTDVLYLVTGDHNMYQSPRLHAQADKMEPHALLNAAIAYDEKQILQKWKEEREKSIAHGAYLDKEIISMAKRSQESQESTAMTPISLDDLTEEQEEALLLTYSLMDLKGIIRHLNAAIGKPWFFTLKQKKTTPITRSDLLFALTDDTSHSPNPHLVQEVDDQRFKLHEREAERREAGFPTGREVPKKFLPTIIDSLREAGSNYDAAFAKLQRDRTRASSDLSIHSAEETLLTALSSIFSRTLAPTSEHGSSARTHSGSRTGVTVTRSTASATDQEIADERTPFEMLSDPEKAALDEMIERVDSCCTHSFYSTFYLVKALSTLIGKQCPIYLGDGDSLPTITRDDVLYLLTHNNKKYPSPYFHTYCKEAFPGQVGPSPFLLARMGEIALNYEHSLASAKESLTLTKLRSTP